MLDNQIKQSLSNQYDGCKCPVCESESIESISEMNLDIRSAWQSVRCNNCDLEWDDVYTLSNIDVQETARIIMLNKINAVGIHIYESDYGYGFTYCEADNYTSEMDVLLAAYKYCIDRRLIITYQTREIDIDDDMPGQYVPIKV
jgi:ribosomal protein S24E